MIEKILIQNYRSIKKQEFSNVGRIMVFVGENNSGKSTVLNALRSFNDSTIKFTRNDFFHGSDLIKIGIMKHIDGITERMQYLIQNNRYEKERSEFEKFYNKDVKRAGKLGSKIYFEEMKNYIRFKYLDNERLRKITLVLEVSSDNKRSYSICSSNFSRKMRESIDENDLFVQSFKEILANIDDERKFVEEASSSKESVTNSVFNMFLDSLENVDEVNNISLQDKKASELSIYDLNYLLSERMTEHSNSFLEIMNEKFKENYSSDLEIDWDFEQDLKSRINFSTKFKDVNSNQFDFMSTGSGTRSIYLISLLESFIEKRKEVTSRNGLFLIEEPELYLYPKLEEKMGEIISKISDNNQVFVTTHSSTMLGYLPKSVVQFVRKIDSQDNGLSESTYQHLSDVSMLFEELGFNAYPFMNKDYILIVEGSSDIVFYNEIIAAHYPHVVDRVGFIQTGGVENIKFSLTTQFLKDSNFSEKFLIITDRDGRNDTKHKNYYMDFLTKIYGKGAKRIYEEKLYSTENATCIETLGYIPELYYSAYELDDFYEKVGVFITQSEDLILECLQSKHKQKIQTDEDQNKIINDLFSNESNEYKFQVLKSRLITKKIHKEFLKNIFQFPMFYTISLDQQRKYAPDLFVIFDRFFGD